MVRAVAEKVLQPIDVLLVDDDPLTAFNTERALRRSQEVATVTIAVDGREAFDLLKSGALRGNVVVLTDLSMPRMSGLELAAAIRGVPRLRKIPIVVLTTSTEAADRQAALAMHVTGFFVKSVASPHLDEMRQWLRTYAEDRVAEPANDP